MNCFQIHRRISFAFIILVINKFILPSDNLLCGNITHFQLAEIWNKFCFNNVLLGFPSIFFQPCLHIFGVMPDKAVEGHIQVTAELIKLFSLPRLGFTLCLKASLLRLFSIAVPIGIAIDNTPSICFFFFIYCHKFTSLSCRHRNRCVL